MAFIDEFLDKHHVLLAGLQEGRLPVAGLLDLPNYFAYTAPATEDGQGGVQCWVHHSLRGSVVRAGCNPQSPRLLRLELSGGPLVATVLVAHAPVSSAELAAKTAFWKAFEGEAKRAKHPNKLLVFIDANDDDMDKGPTANAFFLPWRSGKPWG